jgi:hypothetical protein
MGKGRAAKDAGHHLASIATAFGATTGRDASGNSAAMTLPSQPQSNGSTTASIVVGSVVAVVISLLVVLVYLGGANHLSLITPGNTGPSIEALREDFPDTEFPQGIGHDGQQMYAMARDPLSPSTSSQLLDRPQYRWQRPLLPVVAGLIHPGNNLGLVYSLLFVNLIGIGLGAAGLGLLSQQFGGPRWAPVVMAGLPGTWQALAISTSDALACGLAILSIAVATRRRPWLAATVATSAVLAKESIWILLAGFALTQRRHWRMALIPASAAAGWWIVLRATLAASNQQVVEFTWPLIGWTQAINRWFTGLDRSAAATTLVVTCALFAAAIRRHRHSIWIAAWLQLAFVSVLGVNVIGLNGNGPRALLPLAAIVAMMGITPRWKLGASTGRTSQPT